MEEETKGAGERDPLSIDATKRGVGERGREGKGVVGAGRGRACARAPPLRLLPRSRSKTRSARTSQARARALASYRVPEQEQPGAWSRADCLVSRQREFRGRGTSAEFCLRNIEIVHNEERVAVASLAIECRLFRAVHARDRESAP